MTKLRHRLLLFEEMADDFLAIGIVADVLRRPAAGNNQSCIIRCLHVGKSQIGIPTVARLFCVGIVPWLEIMHYESELLLAGRGNMNLIPFFFESLIRVHHLKRLGGITSHNQNLWIGHGTPPSRATCAMDCTEHRKPTRNNSRFDPQVFASSFERSVLLDLR